MPFRLLLLGIFLAMSLAIAWPQSSAGTVKLWGTADGASTYIEEFSDGFIRVDLYDPPPRETQQRFHSITDPSVTFGSLAYDGFPNDANFRMGSVTYDESVLVNGNGVAPITAFILGVGRDPDDPNYHNYYRWLPTDTVVDNYSGTVTVSNGQPTAINLTSEVHLEVNIVGNVVDAPGTFSITGDRFAGTMEYLFEEEYSSLWDFAGTLTTLAEPNTLGNFNGNGIVDARDFLAWQRGESPEPFSNGDLAAWQDNYGTGTLHAISVPEPSVVLLLVPSLMFMIRPGILTDRYVKLT